MISLEYLITTLIVVLVPGTGVIYTLSIGLFKGKVNSVYAALGCTLGIIPHIFVSILTLSFLIQLNDIFINIVKVAGVVYILYLAWTLWFNKSNSFFNETNTSSKKTILMEGFLINILNPKLSVFLIAFLPQYIPSTSSTLLNDILKLSAVFMLITLVIFITYGFIAVFIRQKILKTVNSFVFLQKVFSIFFVIISLKMIQVGLS